MTVRFEDDGLEEFVMSGESSIAVPVEIELDADGAVTLTVYKTFERGCGRVLEDTGIKHAIKKSWKEKSRIYSGLCAF